MYDCRHSNNLLHSCLGLKSWLLQWTRWGRGQHQARFGSEDDGGVAHSSVGNSYCDTFVDNLDANCSNSGRVRFPMLPSLLSCCLQLLELDANLKLTWAKPAERVNNSLFHLSTPNIFSYQLNFIQGELIGQQINKIVPVHWDMVGSNMNPQFVHYGPTQCFISHLTLHHLPLNRWRWLQKPISPFSNYCEPGNFKKLYFVYLQRDFIHLWKIYVSQNTH